MADVTIVTDLGYGDAGKGSVVDWLCREQSATLVVRYNGGSQAAHNVVTPDGVHHCFSQFGSGTLAGTRTYLSEYMLVAPEKVLYEAEQLLQKNVLDPLSLMFVHERAPVTTPFHRAANRIREILRGGNLHGSCGHGIGETQADVERYGHEMLYVGDLSSPEIAREKLRYIRARKRIELMKLGDVPELASQNELLASEWMLFEASEAELYRRIVDVYQQFRQSVAVVGDEMIASELNGDSSIIFEGAQGILLDQEHGFFPYVTRSTTTMSNAYTILERAGFAGKVMRLGLTRAYMVRHGPGPFPTEDPSLQDVLMDRHNTENQWQKDVRLGWLDIPMLKYACDVNGGVDGLVVTCMDRLNSLREAWVCTEYAFDSEIQRRVIGTHYPSILVNSSQENSALRNTANPPLLALGVREKLVGFVAACKPVYSACTREYHDYVCNALKEALGVPVRAVSHGPTANDKEWLMKWW